MFWGTKDHIFCTKKPKKSQSLKRSIKLNKISNTKEMSVNSPSNPKSPKPKAQKDSTLSNAQLRDKKIPSIE
jgi:hypothetical protein